MKKTTRIVLVIFVLLFVAGGITVAAFWDSLAIYITQKTVLSKSVSEVFTGLQTRLESSPARILYRGLDPEGKQTASILLHTEDPLLGSVEYDMTVQTQPNQLQGEGWIRTDKNHLDLSLYMDTEYMAVSSDSLVQGSYYGITYDTFSEDIRKIPLLSWMLGDALINSWDQSLRQIQSGMSKQHAVTQLPQFDPENAKIMMLALMAAPAHRESTTIQANGQTIPCHRITYALNGEKLPDAIKERIPSKELGEAKIGAAFYLSENALLLADVRIAIGEKSYHFLLESGADIIADPLTISVSVKNPEEDILTSARFFSSREEEMWDIRWQGQTFSAAYTWDSETGDMLLTQNGTQPISLNLSEAETGFCVKTEDFTGLLSVLSGEPQPENSTPVSGTVVIVKGADISSPDYKNLDQWSMDDFLTLLEGLGALIGINFA